MIDFSIMDLFLTTYTWRRRDLQEKVLNVKIEMVRNFTCMTVTSL